MIELPLWLTIDRLVTIACENIQSPLPIAGMLGGNNENQMENISKAMRQSGIDISVAWFCLALVVVLILIPLALNLSRVKNRKTPK